MLLEKLILEIENAILEIASTEIALSVSIADNQMIVIANDEDSEIIVIVKFIDTFTNRILMDADNLNLFSYNISVCRIDDCVEIKFIIYKK